MTARVCLNLESSFVELSSSSVQASKLRDAFEEINHQKQLGVCSNLGIDGHVAANVLKQFFRQLNKPLIPDEVLKLSKELKCVSDESFATSVRNLMNSWPTPHRCTLQFLLSFLQLVMRNIENRMTVTGLAVVFGPNIFRISGGIEGLEIQSLANQTVERLLLTSDIICGNLKDDQGYLDMAASNSPSTKPARVAPGVPLKARPLPPPPVPAHASNEAISKTISAVSSLPVPSPASPPVPSRSVSLNRSPVLGGSENGSFDEFTTDLVNDCVAETELADQVANESSVYLGKEIVDKTIRHVVRKHLFPADSLTQCVRESTDSGSHDSDDDATTLTLLPSLTAGRPRGPKNRRKPSKRRRVAGEVSSLSDFAISDCEDQVAPLPLPRKSVKVSPSAVTTDPTISDSHAPMDVTSSNVTSSGVTVTTPDSGCLTAEDDFSQHPVQSDKNAVLVPKLNLAGTMEDKFDDISEVVPPLDLSEVTQFDEVVQPQPLPRQQKVTPTKERKKKKKGTKHSSHQRRSSPKPPSEPINIPVTHISTHTDDDEVSSDLSTNGSSRWRDAWSTDEETVPMATALENNMRHDVRYPVEEQDIEMAPSSPDNHFARHHAVVHHHHHHSHHHRHHHDNHINRPKLSNSLKETSAENFDEIFSSLQEVLASLDINRKENARPEDLTLMTREQIRMEKIAMQRELLKHESRHGRPASKQEKEIMRGVYDRYRTVKRLLADTMSPPFNTPLHRRLDDVEHDYDVNLIQQTDEFAVTQLVALAPPEWKKRHPVAEHPEVKDHISADLSISELRKQQREAKGQKKRLRRKLRDFEREIEQQHGRPMNQADRVVMATEYSEYRDLKAKLRLLEALIEKHNAQHRSL